MPVDKSFERGTNVRVNCAAKGHMPPTVKWMWVSRRSTEEQAHTHSAPLQTGRLNIEGDVVEHFEKPAMQTGTERTFPENVRAKNGTLYFYHIDYANAGLYTCAALNDQGVINVTVKVHVSCFYCDCTMQEEPFEGIRLAHIHNQPEEHDRNAWN